MKTIWSWEYIEHIQYEENQARLYKSKEIRRKGNMLSSLKVSTVVRDTKAHTLFLVDGQNLARTGFLYIII
jgi:hypothetical protein